MSTSVDHPHFLPILLKLIKRVLSPPTFLSSHFQCDGNTNSQVRFGSTIDWNSPELAPHAQVLANDRHQGDAGYIDEPPGQGSWKMRVVDPAANHMEEMHGDSEVQALFPSPHEKPQTNCTAGELGQKSQVYISLRGYLSLSDVKLWYYLLLPDHFWSKLNTFKSFKLCWCEEIDCVLIFFQKLEQHVVRCCNSPLFVCTDILNKGLTRWVSSIWMPSLRASPALLQSQGPAKTGQKFRLWLRNARKHRLDRCWTHRTYFIAEDLIQRPTCLHQTVHSSQPQT